MLEKYLGVHPDLLGPLRGHDLACWCRLEQPCHADTLIELANRPPPALCACGDEILPQDDPGTGQCGACEFADNLPSPAA